MSLTASTTIENASYATRRPLHCPLVLLDCSHSCWCNKVMLPHSNVKGFVAEHLAVKGFKLVFLFTPGVVGNTWMSVKETAEHNEASVIIYKSGGFQIDKSIATEANGYACLPRASCAYLFKDEPGHYTLHNFTKTGYGSLSKLLHYFFMIHERDTDTYYDDEYDSIAGREGVPMQVDQRAPVFTDAMPSGLAPSVEGGENGAAIPFGAYDGLAGALAQLTQFVTPQPAQAASVIAQVERVQQLPVEFKAAAPEHPKDVEAAKKRTLKLKRSADAKEAKAKLDKEASDAKEAKAKLDKEASDAKEARAKLDKEQKDKEAKAAKEAKAKLDKEAQDAKEAKAKLDKEAQDAKDAKAKLDKEAQDAKEAKAKLDKEAKEAKAKLDKEQKDKEAKAKLDKEQKDKEAKAKLDKEKLEKEAKDAKAKLDKEVQEQKDKEAKAKLEKEAKDAKAKLDKDAKEAKAKLDKEAKEKEAKEAKEKKDQEVKEAQEKAKKKEAESKKSKSSDEDESESESEKKSKTAKKGKKRKASEKKGAKTKKAKTAKKESKKTKGKSKKSDSSDDDDDSDKESSDDDEQDTDFEPDEEEHDDVGKKAKNKSKNKKSSEAEKKKRDKAKAEAKAKAVKDKKAKEAASKKSKDDKTDTDATMTSSEQDTAKTVESTVAEVVPVAATTDVFDLEAACDDAFTKPVTSEESTNKGKEDAEADTTQMLPEASTARECDWCHGDLDDAKELIDPDLYRCNTCYDHYTICDVCLDKVPMGGDNGQVYYNKASNCRFCVCKKSACLKKRMCQEPKCKGPTYCEEGKPDIRFCVNKSCGKHSPDFVEKPKAL